MSDEIMSHLRTLRRKCHPRLSKMGTLMYIQKYVPSLSVFSYFFCLCLGRANCLPEIGTYKALKIFRGFFFSY